MPFPRHLTVPLALAAALAIAGCGSSIGSQVPTWAGGASRDVPQRTPAQPTFPDIHHSPPARPTKLISEQEQARIQAELAAIRDKVNAQSGALQKQRTGTNR